MTYKSDIAIDDISFSKNLTCVSAGKNTPPETFEGNVQRLLDRRDEYEFVSVDFTDHNRPFGLANKKIVVLIVGNVSVLLPGISIGHFTSVLNFQQMC